MPGRQPKQGLQYEILAAAALKTQPLKGGGISLDLTPYEFNVNPAAFRGDLTGIGVDVEPDFTAIHDDLTFLVQCKSSTTPGHVLRIRSDEFLKTIIEFLGITCFSERSGWHYRFLLITDFPIGIEIRELMKYKTSERMQKISTYLAEWGSDKYGDKFNATAISSGSVRATLDATWMDDRLTFENLKQRFAIDDKFRSTYEEFSSRLRRPTSSTIGIEGSPVTSDYSFVRVSCQSDLHDECDEYSVDGTICHLAHPKRMMQEVASLYTSLGSPMCCSIDSSALSHGLTLVSSTDDLDAEDISRILTSVLERLSASILPEATLLVTPGTLDIVIAARTQLGRLIVSAHDSNRDQYDLGRIPEIKTLGPLVQISLARKILRDEYRIVSLPTHYVVDVASEEAF